MFSDDEMKAKALEICASTDLTIGGWPILRVATRLQDATPVDGHPQPFNVIVAYAAWAIEQGQPSPLVVALAAEFTADQLRGMAAAIAEEGWSDTGTAFEALRSALVAAARVLTVG